MDNQTPKRPGMKVTFSFSSSSVLRVDIGIGIGVSRNRFERDRTSYQRLPPPKGAALEEEKPPTSDLRLVPSVDGTGARRGIKMTYLHLHVLGHHRSHVH